MIAALLTALAAAAEECGTEQCDASQVVATCGTWCRDGSTEAPKGLFLTPSQPKRCCLFNGKTSGFGSPNSMDTNLYSSDFSDVGKMWNENEMIEMCLMPQSWSSGPPRLQTLDQACLMDASIMPCQGEYCRTTCQRWYRFILADAGTATVTCQEFSDNAFYPTGGNNCFKKPGTC